MKSRKGWRGGFGLSQIMALLLVVLPTIAFIVTLIFDYWSVMQADYKLKLIANMASGYYNSKEDITDTTDINTSLMNKASILCPSGTTLSESSRENNESEGVINLNVEYLHDGTYFKNKTLSTNIITYSYHDQNLSAVLTCQ